LGYGLAGLLGLGLWAAGGVAPLKASEISPNNPSAVSQPVGQVAPAESQEPSKDLLKRHAKKIILMDILAIATLLFLILTLLSVFRMIRHHRRRLKLGQKAPPTQCEDAWSQYRLDDDPTKQDKS